MIRYLFSRLEPKTSLLASSENQKKKLRLNLPVGIQCQLFYKLVLAVLLQSFKMWGIKINKLENASGVNF